MLVFVDEYPASLNVRHCLVKQKTRIHVHISAQIKHMVVFPLGTCGRNHTLRLFFINSAGQHIITQKQVHMLANTVYFSLIPFF